jgi:hypothetical protein
MTLEIDGQRVLNCKDVEICLAQSPHPEAFPDHPPTKIRMIALWVRETDGRACRKSAKHNIKILETGEE